MPSPRCTSLQTEQRVLRIAVFGAPSADLALSPARLHTLLITPAGVAAVLRFWKETGGPRSSFRPLLA